MRGGYQETSLSSLIKDILNFFSFLSAFLQGYDDIPIRHFASPQFNKELAKVKCIF